jgi:hypothetical protein
VLVESINISNIGHETVFTVSGGVDLIRLLFFVFQIIGKMGVDSKLLELIEINKTSSLYSLISYLSYLAHELLCLLRYNRAMLVKLQ